MILTLTNLLTLSKLISTPKYNVAADMEGVLDPLDAQLHSAVLTAPLIAVHDHQPDIVTTDADVLVFSNMKPTTSTHAETVPVTPASISLDALQGPGGSNVTQESAAEMAGYQSAVLEPAGPLEGGQQHLIIEEFQQPLHAMSCLLQVASIQHSQAQQPAPD